VDGTIYSNSINGVPGSTRHALTALRHNDIRIVAATGRGIMELDNRGLVGTALSTLVGAFVGSL